MDGNQGLPVSAVEGVKLFRFQTHGISRFRRVAGRNGRIQVGANLGSDIISLSVSGVAESLLSFACHPPLFFFRPVK